MNPRYVGSNHNPDKISTEPDHMSVEGNLLWRKAIFFRFVGAALLPRNPN